MSLRKKLLLLTVSMILLTVLTILGASEYFSRQTLDFSVSAAQELAASDLKHSVAGAWNLAETNLAATRLQQETAVKNYLRSGADNALQRVAELHDSLPPEQARQQIREELLRIKIGATGYVFGMNSAGVLTVHPKSEGKDLSDASHIQEMIKAKEGYINYHSVTAKRDKAVFYRYYPPLDLIIAPGVFIDEMASLFDLEAERRLWDKFIEQLRSIRLGQSGSVWIIAADGENRGSFILPPDGYSEKQLAAFPAAAVLEQAKGMEPGQPSLQRLLLQSGQNRQPLMTAIASFPDKGWVIGASVPEQELLATSNRIAASFAALKLAILGAAIVTVLIAAVLTVWLARRSLEPLQRGVDFARQVADGDLTATLQVTSKDEVGALTGALNAMVHGIRTMVQQTKGTTAGMEQITARLASAAEQLEDLSENQTGRASEMASAITQISASIREVDTSVVRLNEAAAENTTSILELSASIEEVSLNMQAVARAGQEVSSAATEMAASSRQIAESTRHLGNASGTTASAIFQMDAGIQSVEQNAGSIADISREVLSDTRESQQAVDSTVTGIREISTSMQQTSEVIRELAERARSIGSIVSVISDVASEVDLLALNAAIIAAQAGAEGRGFAVVAEEIKELAGRTTLSIREITEMVEGVRGGIEQAARLVQVVEDKTRSGETLADRAGVMLVKVVDGVGEVSHGIQQIAGAMSEQATGSQSIKQATETVSSMVGQIVQATTEQEKASQEIQRSSVQLRELAEQVTTSTREQSKASHLIARNTEDMNEMIQTITRACSEQVKSSELILHTGEDVRSGAKTTWQANQVLIESVNGLLAEIETLNRQVAAFQTDAEEPAA
jgi:methyl-accepting chemotaxis protein